MMELRDFNIREAVWQVDGNRLSTIRRLVFILEQQVPQEEEWDGRDEESWHWMATDQADLPIGNCRLLPDGQIGRMAVLQEFRGRGIGAALLEAAVEKARHLGFSEVYLHAQTHALGFYEQLGFTKEGPEFLEAGIPHCHMTQALSPPDDNIQRKARVTSTQQLKVKPFNSAEVSWAEAESMIRRVRRQLLRLESTLSDQFDTDDHDNANLHWLATDDDGHPLAALRMTKEGILSHLAVLPHCRRQGIGHSLIELAYQKATRLQLSSIEVTAHPDIAPFFKQLDFTEMGAVEAAESVDVILSRPVEQPDLAVEVTTEGISVGQETNYRLGVDKQQILLRQESDFRNVLLDMASQAQQSIRIYSPLLCHELFDDPLLAEITSKLARRNKYTRVELLLFDPHRIVKHGHALLTIARKLPSSIGIKLVDPEMRQLNHEFVLVDNKGLIYRQEHDQFNGKACFLDISESNRLGRQFTAAWESGLFDPNLRQIKL